MINTKTRKSLKLVLQEQHWIDFPTNNLCVFHNSDYWLILNFKNIAILISKSKEHIESFVFNRLLRIFNKITAFQMN